MWCAINNNLILMKTILVHLEKALLLPLLNKHRLLLGMEEHVSYCFLRSGVEGGPPIAFFSTTVKLLDTSLSSLLSTLNQGLFDGFFDQHLVISW